MKGSFCGGCRCSVSCAARSEERYRLRQTSHRTTNSSSRRPEGQMRLSTFCQPGRLVIGPHLEPHAVHLPLCCSGAHSGSKDVTPRSPLSFPVPLDALDALSLPIGECRVVRPGCRTCRGGDTGSIGADMLSCPRDWKSRFSMTMNASEELTPVGNPPRKVTSCRHRLSPCVDRNLLPGGPVHHLPGAGSRDRMTQHSL